LYPGIFEPLKKMIFTATPSKKFYRKVNPSVAKTDMGKPLFKAPDGGRFEILWEREDLTQSELQRGQKLPCFSMRWFAQKPFRPAYPCPGGQIFMQYLG
jgi:hypothetical protein